jgi:mono/diheme cytochrome c family protein
MPLFVGRRLVEPWKAIALGVFLLLIPPSEARSPDHAHGQANSPVSPQTITGSVHDARGPVTGAVVRIQTTTQAATTDAEGRFSLSVAGFGKGPFNLTAWATGYYSAGPIKASAGQEGVAFALTTHAAEDNPDYPWVSALCPPDRNPEEEVDCCSACHSREGTDLYPFLPLDEWLEDAHSQAAVNPRFLSLYTGAKAYDDPGRSPAARIRGRGAPSPGADDPAGAPAGSGYRLDFPEDAGNCATCHVPAAAAGAPFNVDPTRISGVAAEGVTCDVCHKVWDVRLDPATGLPFDDLPGVLSFDFRRPPAGGQFFAGPFDDVAPGLDTFSPLQKQSRYCAPCHYGRFQGTVIYNAFGEWQESPYADPSSGSYKTCQNCHMPTGRTCYVTLPAKGGRLRDPSTVASHRMPGASDERHLQSAASLDVTARQDETRLTVDVRVRNKGAGHHLPTGSPLRHVILHVAATDAEGQPLQRTSGPRLPAWAGDLAGLPGRVYARVLEDLQTGECPTPAFWKPTRLASDTRIPALQEDASRYTFLLRDHGPAHVEVRLLHRRAFHDLMRAKSWDSEDILMAGTDLDL